MFRHAINTTQRVVHHSILKNNGLKTMYILSERGGYGVASVNKQIFRAWSTSVTTPAATPNLASTDFNIASSSINDTLRNLCISLKSEHRVDHSLDTLVTNLEQYIESLLRSNTPPLLDEIRHTYETAIATLSKQREYTVIDRLRAHMKHLQINPTTETYQYLIANVALRWLHSNDSQMVFKQIDPRSLNEYSVLEMVRTEPLAHHRKSRTEREHFHQYLRQEIESLLDEYTSSIPLEKQHCAVYTTAIDIYARNHVAFPHLLAILRKIPPESRARETIKIETYMALLRGARFQDILFVVGQIDKAQLIPRNDPKHGNHLFSKVWTQAMLSFINTYTQHFLHPHTTQGRRKRIRHDHIRSLHKMLRTTDRVLNAMSISYGYSRFATIQDHTSVYKSRVKASALFGMYPQRLLAILNDYQQKAPLDGTLEKQVFLTALEMGASYQLTPFSKASIEQTTLEMIPSPTLNAVRQEHEKARQQVEQAKRQRSSRSELHEFTEYCHFFAYQQQQLEYKEATRFLATRRFQDGEEFMDRVLETMANAGYKDKDVEVLSALMQQYLTIANRVSERVNLVTKQVLADLVMERVFVLLQSVTKDTDKQVAERLFTMAIQTATLLWREQDVHRLLVRKQNVLQTLPTSQDYDHLVFLKVVQHDLGGAYEVMQHMHNQGIPPTPLTLHRIVSCIVHQRHVSCTPGGKAERGIEKMEGEWLNRLTEGEEGEDKNMEPESISAQARWKAIEQSNDEIKEVRFGDETEEEEAQIHALRTQLAMASGSLNGPRTLSDVTDFIQEWYYMCKIQPMAKTVVPVFAKLIAKREVHELKRLYQVLDNMEGGITSATRLWLTYRLEGMGMTVDELKQPKAR